MLATASLAIAVAMIVAALTLQHSADLRDAQAASAALLPGSSRADRISHFVYILSAILVALAAINTIVTTWATVIDAQRPTALARASAADRLVFGLGSVLSVETSTPGGRMSTTATRIRQISLVCVPTPDQDRAIEFYESVGLEKRTDTPFGGGYRWVEMYPPEGSTGIALAPPPPDQEVTPTQTGITLTTDDIDATHAELKSRGVDVDAEISRMGDPVPPMFWFRDPTGHTLMVVEER